MPDRSDLLESKIKAVQHSIRSLIKNVPVEIEATPAQRKQLERINNKIQQARRELRSISKA